MGPPPPGMGPGGMGPPPPGAPGMGPGPGRGPPPHRDRSAVKELQFQDFKFVLPFVKKYWGFILGSICCNSLMALIAIVPPLILATIFDQLLPKTRFQRYNYLYVNYVRSLYRSLCCIIFPEPVHLHCRATSYSGSSLQSVFQKILTFPMQYFEENKHGQLLSMVSSDVNVLSDALTMGIINLVTDTFTIVLTAWIMLVLDWQLGLVVICILPLLLIALRGFREKIHKNFEHIQKSRPNECERRRKYFRNPCRPIFSGRTSQYQKFSAGVAR